MVDTEGYPAEYAELAEAFERETGYWPEIDDPRALDLEFLDTLLKIYDSSRERTLDERTTALIQVSVTASTTGFDQRGLRKHIRTALDHGGSVEEILDVFYLTVQLGNHSIFKGASLLSELERSADSPDGESQQSILNRLRSEKPYWEFIYPDVLALYEFDPELLELIMEVTHYTFAESDLDRKTIELISLGLDISTNHLYLSGAKTHVQNALKAGATPEEIIEVYKIVSTEGLQTLQTAIPILLEEADR
jgi:alkylhydroperoxidase/carboxymuconolactone decarboxylase family protein YurZ